MTIAGPKGSTPKKKAQGKKPEAERTTSVVDEVSSKPKYGIRSYLHEFYEIVSPEREEAWYLVPPAPRKKAVILCRAFFIVGLIFLILGTIGIIVGYLWPHQDTIQAVEGQLDDRYYIVDVSTFTTSARIKVLKITALTVFALGGLTVAIALLLPTCCHLWGDENAQSSEPITIYPTEFTTADTKSEKARSPPGSPFEKIPAFEEITTVQPQPKEK